MKSTQNLKNDKDCNNKENDKKINEYLDIILNLDIDNDFEAI